MRTIGLFRGGLRLICVAVILVAMHGALRADDWECYSESADACDGCAYVLEICSNPSTGASTLRTYGQEIAFACCAR